MRNFCLSITILAAIVLALGFPATAQDTPAAAPPSPAPQYFTLNLPAGVSLISAPLDTGQTAAENQFIGLPPQYPLFFAWNPHGQQWVQGEQAVAALGGGYWVYLPTPATLVVQGQPYSPSVAVTDHVAPGWHLFGVPFPEGVGWGDFHLYASGNPISLDTAIANGWVDADITTTQGSQVQYQASGQPLLPGVAYWVHTTVPLDLRAEAGSATSPAAASDTSSTATPSTAASLAGVSVSDVTGTAASVSVASSTSTSSQVIGWLGAVCGFLKSIAEGGADIAEGKFWSAGFDFAGGTFGLIEYGLDSGTANQDSQLTNQLSQIDGQLDTLITDVTNISGQVTFIDSQLSTLIDYVQSNNDLGQYLTDAKGWLTAYVTTPANTLQSREWARWVLAGCNPGAASTCPEANGANRVTQASYSSFAQAYIQHPGSTNRDTDDFPLWWAYSVLGGQSGVTQWTSNGYPVDQLEDQIYYGIVATRPNSKNPGLYEYMEEIFAGSACFNDVTASGCDLYSGVYLPVEAYFEQAIGYQAQLVEAQVEAWETLSAKSAAQSTAGPNPYQNGAASVTAKANNYLNQEAEAFLEVAEQIALYRAAGGTLDWNNFGSSDAGQLLARADFVAAQLAGQNYGNSAFANPAPWPSSRVVGRIFYVDTEPAAIGPRGVRGSASSQQAFNLAQPCTASYAAQLTENSASARSVTGDWPYLLWQLSSGKATGSPDYNWKIQRLTPASLPTGSYIVNSTNSQRLGANLFVGNYDSSYNNLAAPAQGSVVFGSLNSVEGPIGKYNGLRLGQGPWSISGGNSSNEVLFSINYNDPADAPGGAFMNVTFPPTASSDTNTQVTFSMQDGAKFQLAGLTAPFTYQHLHWPNTLNVNLNGKVTSNTTWSAYQGGANYYLQFGASLVLSNPAGNTTYANAQMNACPGSFNSCISNGPLTLDQGSLSLVPGTSYSLFINVGSQVSPYGSSFWTGARTSRSSLPNSAAKWVLDAPVLTLTKQ